MSLRLSLSRTQLRVEMLLYLQVRQLLIMIHAAAGRLDRAPPRLTSDTLYSTGSTGQSRESDHLTRFVCNKMYVSVDVAKRNCLDSRLGYGRAPLTSPQYGTVLGKAHLWLYS